MEHYLRMFQSMRNTQSRRQSSTRLLAATKARASPNQLNNFNVGAESHTRQLQTLDSNPPPTPPLICFYCFDKPDPNHTFSIYTDLSLYPFNCTRNSLIITRRSAVVIGLKMCENKSHYPDVAQTSLAFRFISFVTCIFSSRQTNLFLCYFTGAIRNIKRRGYSSPVLI